MLTRKYDLNLYVINGQIRVLAHQIRKENGKYSTDGSKFSLALQLPLKRANKDKWQPIMDFFEEEDVYNELDSWWLSPVRDDANDYDYLPHELENMPEILKTAMKSLPEYTRGEKIKVFG